MNNVTYYPFLHFFPENFELIKLQFPVAAGLVTQIKEKDLLREGPNSVCICLCCSFKQKILCCLESPWCRWNRHWDFS